MENVEYAQNELKKHIKAEYLLFLLFRVIS